MSGNLICKNNPQLFSFFRFIDNLHNHKSPSRPPGFSLRARAGPGLGPSIKTGLGPSKKGRARAGPRPGPITKSPPRSSHIAKSNQVLKNSFQKRVMQSRILGNIYLNSKLIKKPAYTYYITMC